MLFLVYEAMREEVVINFLKFFFSEVYSISCEGVYGLGVFILFIG